MGLYLTMKVYGRNVNRKNIDMNNLESGHGYDYVGSIEVTSEDYVHYLPVGKIFITSEVVCMLNIISLFIQEYKKKRFRGQGNDVGDDIKNLKRP